MVEVQRHKTFIRSLTSRDEHELSDSRQMCEALHHHFVLLFGKGNKAEIGTSFSPYFNILLGLATADAERCERQKTSAKIQFPLVSCTRRNSPGLYGLLYELIRKYDRHELLSPRSAELQPAVEWEYSQFCELS